MHMKFVVHVPMVSYIQYTKFQVLQRFMDKTAPAQINQLRFYDFEYILA